MRVAFGSFYSSLSDRFNNLNSLQQTALQQMATGQKLTKPSDDPAAMQRVLDQRTVKAQEHQYWKNAGDAEQTSKASGASLDQLNDIFTRVGELTTRGGSEINDAGSFRAFASETDQLLEQALTVANSRVGGKYLHGGTAVDAAPFTATRDPLTNKITAITYNGNAVDAEVRISESSTVAPRTSGAENLQIRDTLTALISARTAMESGDGAAVAALKAGQEVVEDQLLTAISRTGGVQYRLEVSQRQSAERFQSVEELISRDADVDFADASVRFSRAQTAYTAAVQSGAKIAQNSLLDYV